MLDSTTGSPAAGGVWWAGRTRRGSGPSSPGVTREEGVAADNPVGAAGSTPPVPEHTTRR